MKRRILLVVASALVVVLAFVARWGLQGSSTAATVMIEVAAHAPLAPETIELAPIAIETPEESPSSRRAPEIITKPPPVSAVTPGTLSLALRHPNGRPLFDTLDSFDLETAGALRLVLLEECPRVGTYLTSAERKLMHRTTDVRLHHPDQWMRTSFKEPTSGCACVVLGERVLEAVPFVADQPTVVLTVKPIDLCGARCTLEIQVVDDQSLTPIPTALVTIRCAPKRREAVFTDALGRVRWEDLLPGDASIEVAHDHYRRASRTIALPSGRGIAAESIAMSRKALISGTVKWLASDALPARIALIRADSGKELFRTVERDASGWAGKFRFEDLMPAEYIVGFATWPPYPSVDRVKRREVEGWSWVDARYGDVENIWIEVTQAMLDPAAVQKSSR